MQYCSLVRKLFILTAMVFLLSCTAKRIVPEGKVLLHKSEVIITGKTVGFTKSDIAVLAVQKPNRNLLGSRPQVWLYLVTQPKTSHKFWRWINENMGKPPVYFDESLAKSSAEQMGRYLSNVGFYHASVSFQSKKEKKLAEVRYLVNPSWPYRIDSIRQSISDTVLSTFVEHIKDNSLVKKGNLFNVYTLDSERDRITDYLRNNGYYYFTRDYIFFEVDTSLNRKAVNISIRIDNQQLSARGKTDSVESVPHQRYFINRVKIFPASYPFSLPGGPYDTVERVFSIGKTSGLFTQQFYFQHEPRIRPAIFEQLIQVRTNEAYSQQKVRQSYKGIGNLRIYQANKINFDTTGVSASRADHGKNWIDCNISLQRAQAMSYGVDLEGTNSGGDLGVRGSLSLAHKNLFKGGEVFRFRINGGIEAQKLARSTGSEEGNDVKKIFNTTEIGADANIYFPRFLSPVSLIRFKQEYQPKTNLNMGYSSQNRPSYNRTIAKAAFGYDWMATDKISHILTVINLNTVKVNPSAEFADYIEQEPNQRIKEQYSNHLVMGLKYSLVVNSQNINKFNDFVYFRLNFETAGNLLNLLKGTSLITDNGDYDELFGIRYSQFSRIDFDLRYYHVLNQGNRLVFRTVLGIGLPYGNSNDLPFERSFYAGGSNGMRGWQFKALGPGSYPGSSVNIERIGDVQLEASAEYRFPVYSFLNGALFADVGNIWTLKPVDYLPGGDFKVNSFYKELGVDAGIGFRFDFSFFIFRIDAAVPLHNPAKPEGERWVAHKLQLGDSNWQIGIGYPF